MNSKLEEYLKDKGYTQKQVAEILGVSEQYVNALIKGRSNFGKSQAALWAKHFGLSTSWLLTGEGEMLADHTTTPNVSTVPKEASEAKESGIPLIPLEAMAGVLSGTDVSIMGYECELYQVPIFSGADFLIRIVGDSMMPKYSPGNIAACKRVPLDKLWFQWGKVYVVDTRQGALIKRVEPSDAEGCISLHSENPRYKPFDLPETEINGVALVIGQIGLE